MSIQGFKSFADYTALDLDEGITAIVGPNGSGKSNIVEAIRWALGEQSARRLRGYKMDDLIFSGSRRRRAVNLAEVNLLLDNQEGILPTEFAEVSITRRVDREGTGEYYLNRAPCRMRDIQELFLGTGLGRVSYALISQGELDLIITGRPEDRGAMVEEVAGLSRIKDRLHRADVRKRRLSAAMDRVSDSLAEMSERMGPLEREAIRARHHESLTARMRALETSLQLNRLDRLRKEKGRRLKRCERLESDRGQHQELIARGERRLKSMDGQAAELVSGRGKARNQLELIRRDLGRREQARASLRERLRELKRERERVQGELEDSWGRWIRARKDRVEAREALEGLQARSRETARLKEHLEKQVAESSSSHGDSAREVERRQASVADYQRRIQKLEVELARLGQSIQESEKSLDEAKSNLEEQEAALEESSLRGSQLEEQLRETSEEVEEKQRALEQLESKLETLRSTEELLAGRLEALEDRKRSCEARVKALEEMDRLNAGYSRGARMLMGMDGETDYRNQFNILGPLGELIRPRRGFERALEAALGMRASDLVVKSKKDAWRAIACLKSAEAGRVTFWLPEGPQERRPANVARGDMPDGVVARGTDIVDPQSRAAALGRKLLEDVLVFDSLSSVPGDDELARLGLRAVTVEGDLVFAGGARGGAGDDEIWARRVERALAQRDLEGTQRQINTLHEQMKSAREQVASLQSEQGELSEDRDRFRVLEGLVKERLTQHQRRREETRRLTSRLEDRVKGLESDLENDRDRIRAITEERDGLIEALRESEEALEQYRRLLREAEETGEEARSRLSRVSADLDSIAGQVEVRSRWWERLDSDMRSLARSRRSLLERRQELERSEEVRRRSMEAASTAFHDLKEEERALGETLSGYDESLEALRGERRRLAAEVEGWQDRVQQLDTRIHREQVAMARLETEEGSVLQLLRERGVAEEEIEAAEPLDGAQEAQEELESCRKELERMGMVNPLAVGEYERLQSRYGQFSSTWDDLTGALEHLRCVREILSARMKTLFERTIKDIDVCFGQTFERLFGGGECRLVTSDNGPEGGPPGVDIVAQPPGKKLQHLSLLSGGERALTAIAFLFALLDLRAAPFVVFDEIDAALDEGNLDRFCRFVTELNERMQVVLVTHQRRTMECADVLYGTAMDESGVTQIIPARMSDLEGSSESREREAS